MASAAQIAANRKNAARSTGPRSAEGKQRVSRNAVTHGLDCRDVLLPGEDAAAFDHYRAAMLADHQPVGAEEQDCVERMVAAQWRLRRVWRAEGHVHAQASRRLGFEADAGTDVLFDAQNEKALAYLDRKESALTREYHRSSRRLQELQQLRHQGVRHILDEEADHPVSDGTAATASPDATSPEFAEQTQSPPELPPGILPEEDAGAGSDGAILEMVEQSQSGGEVREAA